MQDAMETYFTGERNAGLVLAVLGVVGLTAAVLLYPARWGLRSFAVTLGVMAVIEIAIGVGLYARTGPQVSGLLALFGSDAARFFSTEGARMARVQRNFVIVEYAEVAVILLATVTALTLKHRLTLSGIALGLLLNTAVLLAFDVVAERRGAAYLAALEARGGTAPGGGL
jgi:hypothetical protein